MSASDDAEPDLGTQEKLSQIADLLGVPVQSFTVPIADGTISETHELLQLWLGLKTAGQRQSVLAILRKMTEH